MLVIAASHGKYDRVIWLIRESSEMYHVTYVYISIVDRSCVSSVLWPAAFAPASPTPLRIRPKVGGWEATWYLFGDRVSVTSVVANVPAGPHK